MSLVSFCPSIVTVKQSFIVSQIVSCSVVLSLLVLLNSVNRDLTIRQRRRQWKRRWKIDFASSETFLPLYQVTWKQESYVGTEERGSRPSSERESKIYLLADPVLTSTQNLVISRCSCALCPRHVDRSHRPSILRAKGGGLWRHTRELCSSPQRPQLQLPCYQYCSSNLWSFLAMQSSKNWFS